MHQDSFPISRIQNPEGFTLVELMVAMVLAGMVVAAAFHIQSTYQRALHRQDQITRMQQTLQVTKRMMARVIRGAGGGLSANISTVCGGLHKVGPFVLHNRNSFGATDTTNGGQDTDPDWFEVMGVDQNRSATTSRSFPVTSQEKPTNESWKFRPGDLFVVQNDHGGCLLAVSKITNKFIQHRSTGTQLARCFNQGASMQWCRNNLGTNTLPAGTRLLNLGGATAAFRIDDSDPKRPLLMMASGAAGGDPNQYNWQPVAEGVEDMQIAVQLDTSDPPDALGDQWVNSRDLTAAETARVRAVRLTLVVRSTSEIPGWRQGRRPGYEDRPAAATRDGYTRRVVSTVIKVRNVPLEVTP